jgi:hypothetical protein
MLRRLSRPVGPDDQRHRQETEQRGLAAACNSSRMTRARTGASGSEVSWTEAPGKVMGRMTYDALKIAPKNDAM